MKHHKKGFIGDQLELLVMFFVIGILLVCFLYMYSTMSNTGNTTIDQYMSYARGGVLSWNSLAPLFIIGSGAALVLSAFAIRTHPVFFVAFFLLQVLIAVVTVGLSNAWDSAWTGSALATSAESFDLWTFIMRYFPFVSLILGMIFAIAIFAKGD
jgi:hypothetical protein